MGFINIQEYLSANFNINFNPQQQTALEAVEGAALLLAVPGGGKTTVLVSRVANMIINHGINPENILTMTFNKESAMDMKLRFEQLFGEHIKSTPAFSTIHSFCFSVLREYANFKCQPMPILIENENSPVSKIKLIKDICIAINNQYPTEEDTEEVNRLMGYYINAMIKPDASYCKDSQMPNMDKIFYEYKKFKQKNKLMDFDDMLDYTYNIFRKYPQILNGFKEKYHYINVDEAQDTSKLQHEIIKQLAGENGNIFMVGDEDQSIYAFRGAFPNALMQFDKTYKGGKILKMEENFRCPPGIVQGANSLISNNLYRYQKKMYTQKADSSKIVITSIEDSDKQNAYLLKAIKKAKNHETIAILYRNNPSAIPVVDMLDRENIPFYIKDHKSSLTKQAITQDVLRIINLYYNPFDMDSFRSVYYKLGAFISRDMVEFAQNHQEGYETIFDAISDCPNRDNLSTGKLMYLKHIIAKFGKIPPYKVIDHIIYDFNYYEYLEKGSQNGYLIELYMQKLSCLRFIASGAKTLEEFLERIDSIDGIISKASANRKNAGITLSTIHSAKGLEFDRVYIIDMLEGILPSKMAIDLCIDKSRELIEEETRLFYVGVTRAKKYLEIISSGYSLENMSVSRFVQMLMPQNKLGAFEQYKINMGENVSHKYFGTGRIIGVDYEKKNCTIRFINAGVKTLTIDVFKNPSTIRILE